MTTNSKQFKHSLEIRGSQKNLSSFIKELEELGYKEYEGSNYTGNILAVGPTSGSVLKNSEYGLFSNKVSRREFCIDIDEEKQKQAALCIAAITEGDELSKGELIFVDNLSIKPAFIFDRVELDTQYFYSRYWMNEEEETEISISQRYISNRVWIERFRKATASEVISFFMGAETRKITGFQLLANTPAIKVGTTGYINENNEVVFEGEDVGVKDEHGKPLLKDFYSVDYCVKHPDWFKPVYTPKKVILTLGSNNIKVEISDIIECNLTTFNIEHLNKLLQEIDYNRENFKDISLGGFGVYINKDVRFIRIGCEQENHLFSLNELRLVAEKYKEINNV